MSKLLHLAAAMLGLLAVPAFAQAPNPATPSTPLAPRGAPVAPSTPVVPRVTPTAPPIVTTPRAAPAPAPAAVPPTAAAPRAAPAPAAAATAPAASGKRLDINTAAEPQLDSLPGVGPARSKAIIAGRPYTDLSDLVTKKVVTQGVYDGIKDRIALANINTSTAAEMEKTLKGIGAVRSKAIVSGRPYATPQDLVTKGVLTQGVFNGIKDLVTY